MSSAPVWYHSATVWIGEGLPPNEKAIYIDIRNEINNLFTAKPTLHVLFDVVRKFNNTDVLGMDESIPVLKAVVKYLRHLILDTYSPVAFHKIVQLLDALVRKSGIRAHVLIGRKRFLQTLSLVARQWKKKELNNVDAHEAADYTFDCIQAWHEAFYDLRAIFPEYQIVYFKLVWKYRVQFPRSEDDPSRMPILLEQADDAALLRAGPDEFLLSEQIETNHHLSLYSIYEGGKRDTFRGGFDTQEQLRIIENKQSNILNPDAVEETTNPAAESPSPSKRPGLTQVVSQRSFQIKRHDDGTNSNSNFQILSPVSEDDHDEEEGGPETKDSVHTPHKSPSKSIDEDDDEQSVIVENRAYVVDGRIGIDTRAVLSPHSSVPRKGSRASSYDPLSPNNNKEYDPNSGKLAYDNYKSEEKEKKLKSVPSHLYNQKSVRVFQSIEDRIQRFNSEPLSSDSGKLTPGGKKLLSSHSFGSDDEANNKNIEIRFYGNQRVVIKK